MTMTNTNRRKTRSGRVVSDKMDKTITIAVDRRVRHRLYGKVLKRISKLVVHDEANEYRIGDVVKIIETRPLSKTKRWRVVELIRRADTLEVAVAEAAEADQPVAEVTEDVEASEADEPVAEVTEDVEAAEADEPVAEVTEDAEAAKADEGEDKG